MDRDSPIIAMSETPANPPNPAVPDVVQPPGTVQVNKKVLMVPKPTFVADVAEEYRARFAAVANDDEFRRCTTFRAQCKRANAIINGSLPKKQRVPLKHFAAFFRVRSCASIHTQITAPTDDYVFCGRRPILTDADVDAIIEWVAESVDNPRTLLTLNNIVERVEAVLHKAVSKDCVRAHLAARGATKVMTAMPMEEGRALVPDAVKREYVARMEGLSVATSRRRLSPTSTSAGSRSSRTPSPSTSSSPPRTIGRRSSTRRGGTRTGRRSSRASVPTARR